MSLPHTATADTIRRQILRAVLSGLVLLACLAPPAAAQSGNAAPCGSYGGLAFLGTNAKATAACFMTAIRPQPFGFGDALELRHDATDIVVDAFGIPNPPGLRLWAPGFVGTGPGERHTLCELTQGDCAAASVEQVGGIVLPPGGGSGGTGGGFGDGSGSGEGPAPRVRSARGRHDLDPCRPPRRRRLARPAGRRLVFSDTRAIEETEAVTFRIGFGIAALAPNGGRFDVTVDYGRDGDGLAGVEGNPAYALRF
ncbi:hypothetical protein [Cereibacter sphaeroides]|uniref:hypothetical protein n=1 Tax=Cereibacter sphaeroides TaxID=1063 RepID=UPI001F2651A8|nr:hypothetical protein [Cereibacter sphaeroides]MCE6967435.1 hypothetical protein [Cereibacter sphaeroides]